jgi:hypothetical protein
MTRGKRAEGMRWKQELLESSHWSLYGFATTLTGTSQDIASHTGAPLSAFDSCISSRSLTICCIQNLWTHAHAHTSCFGFFVVTTTTTTVRPTKRALVSTNAPLLPRRPLPRLIVEQGGCCTLGMQRPRRRRRRRRRQLHDSNIRLPPKSWVVLSPPVDPTVTLRVSVLLFDTEKVGRTRASFCLTHTRTPLVQSDISIIDSTGQ